MRASNCGSELVVLARRRALTGTEMMALRTHLVECQECRLAQQVAEDFQHEPIAADDGAAVLRMSELARRWARERERPQVAASVGMWRPMRVLAVAAATLLIAGSVSAFWLWRGPQVADPARQSSTSAPVGSAPSNSPAVSPSAVSPVLPSPAPVPAASSPSPMSSSPATSALPAAQPSGDQHASPALSAALLLQRANEARRRGDISQAISLYRQLQQAFPTSSEAVLSAAPLGGLLLERGGARPALDQFDRYLRAAPSGVLVPEALYGRGRALRALGNATEERRTWRRLIDAFPDSPYAPLARRRLADLQ